MIIRVITNSRLQLQKVYRHDIDSVIASIGAADCRKNHKGHKNPMIFNEKFP